jgi:hypothetical protein
LNLESQTSVCATVNVSWRVNPIRRVQSYFRREIPISAEKSLFQPKKVYFSRKKAISAVIILFQAKKSYFRCKKSIPSHFCLTKIKKADVISNIGFFIAINPKIYCAF